MSAFNEEMTFRPDGHVLRVCGDGTRSRSSVLIAGDWASCRCYADAAERSPEDLYGRLAGDIRDADISIVSLECALAGDTPVLKEGPNLKGTPESAKALREAGFELATLGNNHSADFGPDGLLETVRLCDAAGLATAGAGRKPEKPFTRSLEGARFGVLNLAEPEGPEPDHLGVHLASSYEHRVSEWIRDLKAACDVAMVVIHGGREYVPVPPFYWYDLLLSLADAGADIIVAHHPHVPHGGTIRHTPDGRLVPVFFSTGNFIFRPAEARSDQIPPHTADGYMVRVGLGDGAVAAVDLIPYQIDGGNGARPIAPDAIDRFAHMMHELSAELTDRDRVIAWYDTIVDFQWERHYRARFESFTRKWFEGDVDALRWVRSHHSSPTHARLIDRALMRVQDRTMGTAPAELTARLEQWYAGTWPCGGFGRSVPD